MRQQVNRSASVSRSLVQLWVKAVGPAPARDEVRFVGFKGYGKFFNVALGGDSAVNEDEVRGNPCEIERSECAKEVSTVNGAEAIGQDEVVDDAGPEIVGHSEGFLRHDGQTLESEESVRR